MFNEKEINELKESHPLLTDVLSKLSLSSCYNLMALRNRIEDTTDMIERCEKTGLWASDPRLDPFAGLYRIERICNQSEPFTPQLLLEIRFDGGAYVFGREYDTEYFNAFFSELQEFTPDYIDSVNHEIYYKPERAKEGYEHYRKVFQKYREGYASRSKQKKIESLKKQLAELEDSVT